jgi:hypothetical protein
MSDYFDGKERLQTFLKTGAPMRMGTPADLMIPDYQVLRNLLEKENREEALSYLGIYHAQNIGMNSLLFDWCMAMTKIFAETTSPEIEKTCALRLFQTIKR